MKDIYINELKEIRRKLHTIPEMGYAEFKTKEYIANYLSDLGLKPQTIAKTGVSCYLDFGKNETIALRCDIDGLKIKEMNEYDYKSIHEGYMHACGHDAHMSMLLTLAKILSEEDAHPKANILLIFQPAEEGPGGAKKVIEEGILDKYNAAKIYALHVSPDYKTSEIASRAGAFLAGGVELYFDITGKSAHAAQPQNAIDALYAACNLVYAIESVIPKNIDPFEDAVLSICKFHAGEQINIIASHAQVQGILRTFSGETKEKIIEKIIEICAGIENTCDVKIDFNPVYFYPPLINDEKLYCEAKQLLGKAFVESRKMMLSEDFAYYSEKIPSLFMMLGIDDGKKEHQYPLHSEYFDLDEKVLAHGVEAYLKLITG